MKKYLASFATPEFRDSQRLLIKSARQFGIDDAFTYSRQTIRQTEFYARNRQILDSPRGAGYWLWKPYCILDALARVNDGDLVMYADAGAEVISDLSPLFDLCVRQGGIVLFRGHGNFNRLWVKRDCYILMDCDSEKYWNAEQVTAGYGFYLKAERPMAFLREWLNYGCNPNIITDLPNVCGLPNLPEFRENRHDQAILSLLVIKHGIGVFRNPSQWGDAFKNDSRYIEGAPLHSPYGAIFNLHRTRKKLSLLGKAMRLVTGE